MNENDYNKEIDIPQEGTFLGWISPVTAIMEDGSEICIEPDGFYFVKNGTLFIDFAHAGKMTEVGRVIKVRVRPLYKRPSKSSPEIMIKDLLNDLESDIVLIETIEDFKDDKFYLLNAISTIRKMLGIMEEEK